MRLPATRRLPYRLAPPLLLSVLVAGCATIDAPALAPAPVELTETTYGIKSIPSLGRPYSVETGERLYVEYPVSITQNYTAVLKQPASAAMAQGHRLELRVGESGWMSRTHSGHKSVCWLSVTTVQGARPASACIVDSTDSGSFDSVMFPERAWLYPLAASVAYDVVRDAPDERKEGGIRREILYQGVSKGTIKLSYREFAGNLARPAFTQDVKYDLVADGTALVVFKGVRVKVLEATSARLQYVVQQPFAR